ncbi:DUF370 domain-containing protein [Clostridium sp.]|uniref:DUF370 domain-containing protein n=1 Tax=Clostridium sp. TaxID=1506 RepID=UPI00263533C1|nr:DUF370 domain-containing protein [Clostridium sp.]
MKMLNIGYDNYINKNRIIAIVNSKSNSAKRLVENARDNKELMEATEGRRTLTVILTDTGQVLTSAIESKTLSKRFMED